MERTMIDTDYVEVNKINELVKKYNFKENNNLLIGMDKDINGNVDFVVYDKSDMLEIESNDGIEEFNDIVRENALDPEEFEIDRITFYDNRAYRYS